MANVAEVIFRGTDETSSVAKRVGTNIKQTSQEMKGLGMAFSQASTLANQFGNVGMAGVVTQLGNAASTISMFTKEMAKSKAGIVALGAAVAAGSAAIGGSIGDWLWGGDEAARTGRIAALEIQLKSVNESLALTNKVAAAEALVNQEMDHRLSVLGQIKSLSGGDRAIIEGDIDHSREAQLDDIRTRQEEKETEAGMKLALRQQEYGAQAITIENEFAGQKIAVRMWESEQRRQIDDMELVSEEAKGSAKVALAKVTAAKIGEINQRSKDAEAARWKGQLNAFASYTGGIASGLGQLASVTATMGKKYFRVTQALRYGEAVMSTAAGIARAYAEYPWPYSSIVAAITGAAGLAQVAAISSAKGPQAHGGLDYVPQEATYKLSRGEMVLDPGTSDMVRNNALGGGGSTHVTVQIDGETLFRAMGRASRDGRLNISARGVV
jgi:hypothetical protein